MADIKLAIVNQALTAAGEEMITSLTAGEIMANAAIANYDSIVGEELENGTWKFATKINESPTLLTATLDGRLQYQWQRASDDIGVQAVLYSVDNTCERVLDGHDYDVIGDVVRTRYNTGIKIKYTYRPDESLWPQRFNNIIAQRLEALFLRVTERFQEAQGRDEAADIKTMVAKHSEARQRNNTPLVGGTLVDARMGRRMRRNW